MAVVAKVPRSHKRRPLSAKLHELQELAPEDARNLEALIDWKIRMLRLRQAKAKLPIAAAARRSS